MLWKCRHMSIPQPSYNGPSGRRRSGLRSDSGLLTRKATSSNLVITLSFEPKPIAWMRKRGILSAPMMN